jgi:hypothetical protein
MRRRSPAPAKAVAPAFRSNRKWIKYAGRNWRLKADRGTWLYVERGPVGAPLGQWIHVSCAS